MKSQSNKRPQVLHDLGNGSHHYNFNIVEKTIDEEDGKTSKVFEYDQVLIWDTPTEKKVVKEVIRSKWDANQEFDLVNSYNAFNEGVSDDESDKDNYLDYLDEIRGIKAMVKHDFT
ncbi:hypothetical protein [Albibacterium profundi]|uniref:Uncharacterized protein n=1 Tax=Albibacterium profundi TaxID=3134906 RepID=A0ABV5CEZ1_9SPHI